MLTSIGKFLRKLRVDHGEILKDMAEKLDVTVSFLSAVENGKKHMPATWNSKICALYDLNEVQQKEFTTAIAETEEAIEMDLVNANIGRRELAVSLTSAMRKLKRFVRYFLREAKNELL